MFDTVVPIREIVTFFTDISDQRERRRSQSSGSLQWLAVLPPCAVCWMESGGRDHPRLYGCES